MQCDLVSGFVRFQWQLAIAAPTRMPTKTAITVVGPQPGAFGTEARQQDEGLIKTKAARRVVSERGAPRGDACVLVGIRSQQNPHETSRTLLSLFQSVGALYFPQDHSQGRPKLFHRR